jgi:hypothetical protein
VSMHDTRAGFKVVIRDLTTGESGSMTASVSNGFAHVIFGPDATSCTEEPYAFHPMYSTSSQRTNITWGEPGNIQTSVELGHFEYCDSISAEGGFCTAPGNNDRVSVDNDDDLCFSPLFSTLVQVTGCTDTDADFDGVSYLPNWPGSSRKQIGGRGRFAEPIMFSSPLTHGGHNFERIAFEADLPVIESECDLTTGKGCTNPPSGSKFYPIFSTRFRDDQCHWQFGGANLPDTRNSFGGSSTTEFGPLVLVPIPRASGASILFRAFRRVLSTNPCPARLDKARLPQ